MHPTSSCSGFRGEAFFSLLPDFGLPLFALGPCCTPISGACELQGISIPASALKQILFACCLVFMSGATAILSGTGVPTIRLLVPMQHKNRCKRVTVHTLAVTAEKGNASAWQSVAAELALS